MFVDDLCFNVNLKWYVVCDVVDVLIVDVFVMLMVVEVM